MYTFSYENGKKVKDNELSLHSRDMISSLILYRMIFADHRYDIFYPWITIGPKITFKTFSYHKMNQRCNNIYVQIPIESGLTITHISGVHLNSWITSMLSLHINFWKWPLRSRFRNFSPKICTRNLPSETKTETENGVEKHCS